MKIWRAMTRLFVLSVAIALLGASAQAQVIRLFGSDADVKALLHAQGFDRLDIVDRGLSSTTFHACYGRDRVQFKFYWDGRIGTRNKIGGCRVMVTIDEAHQILARQGYDRINLEDRAGEYTAIACRQGDRVRVTVTHQGDIRRERRIGECRDVLQPSDVEAKLAREGYERIRFTDRQLPKYVALACDNGERFELSINRFGEVRSRRPVGECERPINPADLPSILADRGLTRIQVTDSRLPRYKVEACRDRNRVEVKVNRFGEIINEVRIGRCRPRYNGDQIRDLLTEAGYIRINLTDNGDAGFLIVACRDEERHELLVNAFAEVLRENKLGRCTSPSLSEFSDKLADNGFRDIVLQAQVCRRGRLLRLEIDEFGEIVRRERIGGC